MEPRQLIQEAVFEGYSSEAEEIKDLGESPAQKEIEKIKQKYSDPDYKFYLKKNEEAQSLLTLYDQTRSLDTQFLSTDIPEAQEKLNALIKKKTEAKEDAKEIDDLKPDIADLMALYEKLKSKKETIENNYENLKRGANKLHSLVNGTSLLNLTKTVAGLKSSVPTPYNTSKFVQLALYSTVVNLKQNMASIEYKGILEEVAQLEKESEAYIKELNTLKTSYQTIIGELKEEKIPKTKHSEALALKLNKLNTQYEQTKKTKETLENKANVLSPRSDTLDAFYDRKIPRAFYSDCTTRIQKVIDKIKNTKLEAEIDELKDQTRQASATPLKEKKKNANPPKPTASRQPTPPPQPLPSTASRRQSNVATDPLLSNEDDKQQPKESISIPLSPKDIIETIYNNLLSKAQDQKTLKPNYLFFQTTTIKIPTDKDNETKELFLTRGAYNIIKKIDKYRTQESKNPEKIDSKESPEDKLLREIGTELSTRTKSTSNWLFWNRTKDAAQTYNDLLSNVLPEKYRPIKPK